jgi:two-component system sensor histidine kinase KdpD
MRILRAFANQGAMAFERAILLEADTKAKVLEESDRLKSSLLSSVSHEFNTPLATIKASITSLLDGEVNWDPYSLNDLFALINEETDDLIYLVTNLLNMSRIEAGALKPLLQWNMLSEIVEGTLIRMYRSLEKHSMEVDLPDNLPLVSMDYVLMQQVFTNLLSNSAKYSPEGSTIRIWAREKERAIQVTVQNQGPPVAPEHLERIFDKFYRLSYAEKVSGTGLGLSICKGIIEAHHGRIWAENIADGLAFCFTLPLVSEGNAPLPLQSETS